MSDIIPINKDHSNLVKFTEDSPDYAIIARKLRELIENTFLPLLKPTIHPSKNAVTENYADEGSSTLGMNQEALKDSSRPGVFILAARDNVQTQENIKGMNENSRINPI
jgi:hypothetical protein